MPHFNIGFIRMYFLLTIVWYFHMFFFFAIYCRYVHETFEDVALQPSSWKPKEWFRYDDTFIVWFQDRETFQVISEHSNKQYCDINFTIGIENNGFLPWLDVFIKRYLNGRICHFKKILQKTDLYLFLLLISNELDDSLVVVCKNNNEFLWGL